MAQVAEGIVVNAWVISDVHSNLPALDAALSLVDADPAPIVFLGDLLTYGPDPVAVIERLAERDDVLHWVLGNHDELYLGLLRGRTPEGYHRLPGWLRASVEWTFGALCARPSAAVWLRDRPFAREVVDSGIYFAHANPFGDWTYLDGDAVCRRAALTLARRGMSVGIFGHTHRGGFFVEPPRPRSPERDQLAWGPREPSAMPEVRLLDAGSVGQPRNRAGRATALRLRGSGRTGEATLLPVCYDVVRTLDRLRGLPLPRSARNRLCSFFEHFAPA